MSHRNVQKMIRKYSDNASKGDGEPFSAHPHMLRRSRACNLYQNDTPIEVVSVFLGHSSIETTKDHYAFPSIEQMRKAMESGNGKMPCRKEEPLWEGHEDELARLCGLR
jgi:integrase